MHKPTENEIREAEAMLVERQLTVDAMNPAGATYREILPALRALDSVKGWIFAVEKYGEVRLRLKDV